MAEPLNNNDPPPPISILGKENAKYNWTGPNNNRIPVTPNNFRRRHEVGRRLNNSRGIVPSVNSLTYFPAPSNAAAAAAVAKKNVNMSNAAPSNVNMSNGGRRRSRHAKKTRRNKRHAKKTRRHRKH